MLFNMLKNLIKTCFTTSNVKFDNFSRAQISYMGTVSDANVVFPYGTKSGIPNNTAGVCLNICSNEDNKIMFPYMINKYSKLPSITIGDHVIGNEETGDYVLFKKDGSMTIKCSGKLTIDSGSVEMTGILTAPDVIINGISEKDHKHSLVTAGTDPSGPRIP